MQKERENRKRTSLDAALDGGGKKTSSVLMITRKEQEDKQPVDIQGSLEEASSDPAGKREGTPPLPPAYVPRKEKKLRKGGTPVETISATDPAASMLEGRLAQ
jgi:hypothetical protein